MSISKIIEKHEDCHTSELTLHEIDLLCEEIERLISEVNGLKQELEQYRSIAEISTIEKTATYANELNYLRNIKSVAEAWHKQRTKTDYDHIDMPLISLFDKTETLKSEVL